MIRGRPPGLDDKEGTRGAPSEGVPAGRVGYITASIGAFSPERIATARAVTLGSTR